MNDLSNKNSTEEITDEIIKKSLCRCIEKNNALDGILKLKDMASNCKTKADYIDFFKNTLKLDIEKSEKGIIMH